MKRFLLAVFVLFIGAFTATSESHAQELSWDQLKLMRSNLSKKIAKMKPEVGAVWCASYDGKNKKYKDCIKIIKIVPGPVRLNKTSEVNEVEVQSCSIGVKSDSVAMKITCDQKTITLFYFTKEGEPEPWLDLNSEGASPQYRPLEIVEELYKIKSLIKKYLDGISWDGRS